MSNACTPILKFELLCNNVAARLLQGSHKVETVSNPKLFQGCGQVVTTSATWSQGCHTFVTSLKFLYGIVHGQKGKIGHF